MKFKKILIILLANITFLSCGAAAESRYAESGENVFLPLIINNVIITENNLPNIPTNPDPSIGESTQNINVNLSWFGGDPDGDDVTYDIYFAADETEPGLRESNWTGTTYDPGALEYNTTYYWQIIAKDEHGGISDGQVWEFITVDGTNQPPHIPTIVSPESSATDQSINVNLSWLGGDPDGDIVTYDIYLAANDKNPGLVESDLEDTTFDPGTLLQGTNYFWQVVAKDEHGVTSMSPVWIFRTNSSLYPLRKSPDPNARYLVDANNQPFFINGATPWSLIGQVSKEDAELYISDSASKGVNSLIITLVESHYADNAPANYYGDYPFVDNGNPTSNFTHPNEAYFAHADWVINKANEYGIQVILAPNYLGCCNDGYLDELLNDNTEADAEWFGAWVGARYKNFPNLIYVWGNDLNPDTAVRSKIFAMVSGVKSQDPNHLHTYHWAPENSAIDQWTTAWDNTLDMNVTYTYRPVQLKILEDYNRNPVTPFILFESHYEHESGADALETRRQAYVAVLSGAGGHHYGNNPIWHMNSKDGKTGEWKNHLDDEGREDLLHIRDFFSSRSWFNLIPDQSPEAIITSGGGSDDGSDYAPAAITSDQKTIIIYIPERRQITVNLSYINSNSNSAKAWWYDPQTGVATLAGNFSTVSETNFIPPSSNSEDWLLVIDDADLNLPAPGKGK